MTTGTSLVCDGGVHHIKPSSSSSSRPLVYSSSSDSLDAPARSYGRTMDRRFMQLESQLTAALRNHRRYRGAAPVPPAATSTSLCSAAKSDDPPPLQSSRPPATSPKLHGSGSRVEHVARSSVALVSLAESTPDAAVLQTDAAATTASTTAASSSSSSSSCCCSSSSSASSSSTSVDSSTDKRDSRPTSEQSVPRRHSAGITPGDQHVPSTSSSSSSSSSSSAGLKLSSFFHTN